MKNFFYYKMLNFSLIIELKFVSILGGKKPLDDFFRSRAAAFSFKNLSDITGPGSRLNSFEKINSERRRRELSK